MRLRFSLFALIALVLSACARDSARSASSQAIGQTSTALVSSLGKPLAIESAPSSAPTGSMANSKLYRYEKQVFQVDGDRVVAVHREPKGEQKKLQFWLHQPGAERHEFAPSAVARRPKDRPEGNESGDDPMRPGLVSVKFIDLQRTVVFDPATGEVVRVIEHGA